MELEPYGWQTCSKLGVYDASTVIGVVNKLEHDRLVIRDVNNSHETPDSMFFLEPRKGISALLRTDENPRIKRER